MPSSAPFESLRGVLCAHSHGDLVSLAARNPNNILMFAGPLSLALRENRLNPRDRDTAIALLGSATTWGVERVPFRQLDLAASALHAGITPRLPVESLLRVSALAVPPVPTQATNEAFYALTHCAFYAYGVIGRAIDPWLDLDAIQASLEACACRCVVTDDIDLGLELVATSALLGLPLGPAQRMLVAEVAQRLASQGVTRCMPSAAAETFMKQRPEEAWAHEFHTMLVAGVTFMLLEASKLDHGAPVPDGDMLFVELMGNACVAAMRYDLDRVAALGNSILSAFDLDAHEGRMLAFLSETLAMGENADGSFGRFVDERRMAELAGTPVEDDPGSARDTQPCPTFLAAAREVLAA